MRQKVKCKIGEWRKRRGYTCYALAQALGNKNQSGLARIEKGENVASIQTALKIAKLLNCKVDDLYELTN